MSVEAMALVLHHSKATGTDKVILLGIANHMGDGGAWPSVATLARYANVTERNVQKSLGRLVRLGELAIDRQAGGTSKTRDHERPNRYDVLVACPWTCDRTMNHRPRPLPKAQADLWTNPPSPATPPVTDDTPSPVTDDTPPVSPATPEPSREPSMNPTPLVSEPQTARASEAVVRSSLDEARAAIAAARAEPQEVSA